ncbi:hypothetical protein Hte_006986 [Hypoxylon texense]
MEEFQTSNAVAQLRVSLFVFGFAVGPLFWGPLSEAYGYFRGSTAFHCARRECQIHPSTIGLPSSGIVGSSPLTNAGALIADTFPASERGLALRYFSFGPFIGPIVGPIVGGLSGVLFLACALMTPETFAPVLLERRARLLSEKTGKVYVSILKRGDATKTPAQVLESGDS